MNLFPVIALVTLALGLTPGPGLAATKSPEKIVKELYTWVFKHDQNPDVATMEEKQDLFQPAFYEALTQAMDASQDDEQPALDFMPFVNAQDEFDSFRLGETIGEVDGTVVPVILRMGKDEVKVDVELVKNQGEWKISNLLYEESDLQSILAELDK